MCCCMQALQDKAAQLEAACAAGRADTQAAQQAAREEQLAAVARSTAQVNPARALLHAGSL